MEGSFVAGAIAEKEGEALFIYVTFFVEALGLKKLGAAAQPLVLCHAFDERIFGAGHGAVLVAEIHQQNVSAGFEYVHGETGAKQTWDNDERILSKHDLSRLPSITGQCLQWLEAAFRCT